jgi:hypothetical protein
MPRCVLRREARPARRPLLVPALVAVGAAAAAAWFVTMPVIAIVPVEIDSPVLVPRLVPVPVPAAPRGPARIDGRIEQVAAASDAPVVALATKDRVWISRDGGASFAPALDRAGNVGELIVDRDGAVYVTRGGVLGVAAPDGGERWSSLPPLDGRLLDATGGALVAEQWDRGAVIADGGGWRTLIGGGEWSVLAAHAGRFLVTARLHAFDSAAPALHVIDAHGDRVVWRGAYDHLADEERDSTPCAAIAGDDTWIVERDPREDRDRSRPARLLRVDAAGHPHDVAIDLDLDADRVVCTIAGNERAAYASVAIDGHAARTYALGRGARYLAGADDLDLRAVDRDGRALGLLGGDLVRRRPDGGFDTLARGR